ncbi:uncharacterized protein LOC115415370 isoform X3 [Sphaeramia orbicularis]|uniref:uncharacterized protein LOC115415370 isoform X3 n=1 Tax=Sphaeramia orbicularis TaxID=375764 RepID=UPI00117DE283|nr:uncharacterized protein LOC115415370 isoform X3 [Sphaeramia orbicularis]
MAALDFMVFVCVCVLLFEGGFSVEHIHVFYHSGQMAILPRGSSPPSTCSRVGWFDKNNHQIPFQQGNGQSPPTDVRFHLSSNCSLVINDVSGKDAGRYVYRPDELFKNGDTSLYLNILTVSESHPDADPNRDGNVALQCSLNRPRSFHCPENSLRWENEDRFELTGTRSSIRQGNCVSTVTVKRPSGHNRTYTCQFVEKNQILISADHTVVLITERKDGQTENPETILYIGAAVGVVVVLVVITVIVKMRCRKRDKDTAKQTDGFQNQNHPTAEPESNLTYVMLDHKNTGASKEVRKEDAVTYSTVKTPVKTETDNDAVYSTVK